VVSWIELCGWVGRYGGERKEGREGGREGRRGASDAKLLSHQV
jgi:hypothetical protein